MVQVRVQRKGASFKDIAEQYKIDVEELKRGTLNQMAIEIVENSPVDSGTYVRNHQMGLRSGSFQATGRRDNDAPRISRGDAVNAQSEKATGLSQLRDDIKQADMSAESFVFRNPMIYANKVESGWPSGAPGYAVYSRSVREASRIIQEVAQRIKSRNR